MVFLLTWLLPSLPATALKNVLAIQLCEAELYEDIHKGFRSACNARITKLVLSDQKPYPTPGTMTQKITELHPDLIFAIGYEALNQVRHIRHIPIVYTFVVHPHLLLNGTEKNITGVHLLPSIETQFGILTRALPKARTIGLLFSYKETGHLYDQLQTVANKAGICLMAEMISPDNQLPIPVVLQRMKSEIDVFWMLPDSKVYGREARNHLFDFARRNRIPVFAVSKTYIAQGAFLALINNMSDLGYQAGEMVMEILTGKRVDDLPAVYPHNVRIAINLSDFRDHKLCIGDGFLEMAHEIY